MFQIKISETKNDGWHFKEEVVFKANPNQTISTRELERYTEVWLTISNDASLYKRFNESNTAGKRALFLEVVDYIRQLERADLIYDIKNNIKFYPLRCSKCQI